MRPTRDNDPFAGSGPGDSVEVCIETLRSLTPRLNLSPEIRARAEAKLQEAIQRELKHREERAAHKNDDPFAN